MIRTILVAVLTLACVALAAAGAISFRHGIPDDGLWIEDNLKSSRFDVAIIRGVIHMVWSRPLVGPPRDHETKLAGFYCRTRTVGQTLAMGAGVPFWAPSGLLAVYPLLAFRSRVLVKWRRRRKNLCTACGYPLEALAEPRCPECGLLVRAPIGLKAES